MVEEAKGPGKVAGVFVLGGAKNTIEWIILRMSSLDFRHFESQDKIAFVKFRSGGKAMEKAVILQD